MWVIRNLPTLKSTEALIQVKGFLSSTGSGSSGVKDFQDGARKRAECVINTFISDTTVGRYETLDLERNGKTALVKLEKWPEAHKGRVQDHLLTVD